MDSRGAVRRMAGGGGVGVCLPGRPPGELGGFRPLAVPAGISAMEHWRLHGQDSSLFTLDGALRPWGGEGFFEADSRFARDDAPEDDGGLLDGFRRGSGAIGPRNRFGSGSADVFGSGFGDGRVGSLRTCAFDHVPKVTVST